MSEPLLPDSSDRVPSKLHRVGGGTLEDWIAAVERLPDRTLPGGVGRMLVEEINRLRAAALDQLMRTLAIEAQVKTLADEVNRVYVAVALTPELSPCGTSSPPSTPSERA